MYRLLFGCLFLFSLFARAQTITHHFTVEDGLPSTEVYFVHQDQDGLFWFCTDRGVATYDGLSFKTLAVPNGLSFNTVFRVYEDPNFNLWFTAYDGSVSYYDFNTKRLRPFQGNDILVKSLQLDVFTFNWFQIIAFIDEKAYFIPLRVNESSKILYCDINDPTAFGSIDYRSFIQEFKDQNAFLFLKNDQSVDSKQLNYSSIYRKNVAQNNTSTVKNFLDSIDLRSFSAPNISYIDSFVYLCTKEGLISNNPLITSLAQTQLNDATSVILDKENQLWFTTLSSGVFVIPNYYHIVHSFNSTVKDFGSFRYVYLMDNEIYMSTTSRLLKLTASNELEPIEADLYPPSFADSFTVVRGMLFKYDTGNPVYLKSNVSHIPSELRSPEIIKFWQDHPYQKQIEKFFSSRFCKFGRLIDDKLYVATLNKLFIVDGTMPIKDYGEFLGLRSPVRNLLPIESCKILATLGEGVVFVNEDSIYYSLNSMTGLRTNIVNQIFIDKTSNTLWVATNQGVASVLLQKENGCWMPTTVKMLSHSEGLHSNYVVDVVVDNNLVYSLSPSGLTVMSKTIDPTSDEPPSIFSLYAVDRDTSFSESSFMLGSSTDYLVFNFNAVSLKRPDNFYRYRLIKDTKQKEWEFTHIGRVPFQNLSEGNYVFEVQARGENSDWGESKRLSFTILPHWTELLITRILGVVVLLIIVGSVTGVIIKRASQKAKSEMILNDLRLENTRLELGALRGQMNPHFVFNVLTSIQKLIVTGKSEGASQLLNKFSKLIRSVLDYSRLEFIPLSKELEFLNNYLTIEKMRFPNRFDFDFSLSEDILPEELYIPPLLLQPICENAIKHAFVKEGGKLSLNFQLLPQSIKIRVEDDGIGYLNANTENENSRGLDIVKRRLMRYKNNNMPSDFKVSYKDALNKTGTVIEMVIPCYEEY